jgi:phosphatidylglycerophosphate synthase
LAGFSFLAGLSVTGTPHAPERRPLSTRDTAWARALAAWLARCGASPNGISLAGMLAGLTAGAALAATPALGAHAWAGFLAAALLIPVRLLANMFDGMVALATGRASPLGELFNELPDRVSDAAVLIGAGYAAGGCPELGYLAACLALFIAYVRAQGKVAGAHQDYGGPMAKQQRMAVIVLAACYAALAPRSWQPELAGWPGHGVLTVALVLVLAGGVVTVAARLTRIAAALRRKSA